MSSYLVLAIILVIGLAGLVIGSRRAASQRTSRVVSHSLPMYHGWLVFIFATVPALIVFIIWSLAANQLVERSIISQLPTVSITSDESLSVGMVHTVANALKELGFNSLEGTPKSYADLVPLAADRGIVLPTNGEDYMIPVALGANATENLSMWLSGVVAAVLAIGGAAYGLSRIAPRARARNTVETVMLWGLIGASTIAIITTVGIVLSMLSETIQFFSAVNPIDFFFGTVWDPRFSAAGSGGEVGQFGLIPLLAGTLYIALVSMLFAVPVGLMAAVYMGEYASPRLRSTVKPLLELLAGIPTIVYGIFAVVTLGPFLRDLSAALAGGTPFIQAQSVFTAGLVMGVMLIPVVSSLSDDVITAVPRAMRDGSLAIGATRSETITRVILPAALPGIVGALLLTASRAIGETMIVVLAAGVAARLSVNPFEAMTTITVKIVNQLTGDLEFNSPQTLVAFALGLTLFVLTLGMNIYALYIVRKYREQYE